MMEISTTRVVSHGLLKPVPCCGCGKLIRAKRYAVRELRTFHMPATGFYYYHVPCAERSHWLNKPLA